MTAAEIIRLHCDKAGDVAGEAVIHVCPRVRCRDRGEEWQLGKVVGISEWADDAISEWQLGKVDAISPHLGIKVWPDGADRARFWDEVEKLEADLAKRESRTEPDVIKVRHGSLWQTMNFSIAGYQGFIRVVGFEGGMPLGALGSDGSGKILPLHLQLFGEFLSRC